MREDIYKRLDAMDKIAYKKSIKGPYGQLRKPSYGQLKKPSYGQLKKDS